jgi:hypothetical protein
MCLLRRGNWRDSRILGGDWMRGARRFAIAVWTAGLLLAPAAASAQDPPPSPDSPAPAAAVGPRELQNFSLSGTVIRPADQPAPQRSEAPASQTVTKQVAPAGPQRPHTIARKTVEPLAAPSQTSSHPPAEPSSQPLQQVATAPVAAAFPPPSAPAAAATFTTPVETTSGTLAPEHGFPILPWLAAALALGAAGAFLFWRNRSRAAVAGGPHIDLFTPEPDRAPPPPAPRPVPPPPPRAVEPAPAPQPRGIVSTGLRPWIDVGMQPLRCIVTDDLVTVEFELDLFNSGSAPARDIHVAAALVNAGATQDQALASFFDQRPGPGERIELIQPLKRVTFTTQIATSREQVQVLEMGGRHVFVPVIAFNASYGWSGKEGQTSVSYLLGREGKSEKLAPFRLDLGPRLFRGVGARPLPIGVRS